jgi:hypothetical protein
MLPIAVLYEHPEWFRPLLAELERRGLPHVRLDAAAHRFDPQDPAPPPWSLLVNRASPSAYLRDHGQATFYTLALLRHAERRGVPVVNGSRCYALELSKADQIGLLAELGLPAPRTRVINHASQALAAAAGLRFPVLVKANVGGSGAGIARFADAAALADAAAAGRLDLGVDRTALVQEYAPLRGDRIVRVETLGGRFLYAIAVYPPAGAFNLCPADACQTADGRALLGACAVEGARLGLRVAAFDPPPEVVREVEAIAAAARLDVGGVEYLVDDRDGGRYYYDINALSNFVAEPETVVGFDPFARLVDWLAARAGA